MKLTNNLMGFCSAPWTEGVLTQEGYLRTCCRNGTSFGNWQTEGLQASWLSSKFIEFRKSILAGIFPDESCKNCYQNGTARSLISDLLGLCSNHLNVLTKYNYINPAIQEIESLLTESFPLSINDKHRFERFFDELDIAIHNTSENLELMNSLGKLSVIGYIARSFLTGELHPKHVAPFRQVNLSDLCNARCIQCPGLYYGNIIKGDTLDESYLDEAFSHSESIIDFFMNGAELLAYPGWKKVADRLLCQGVKLSISTNGILLNKDTIHYLIDNKVISKLNISMDGARKSTVENIRVNVNFDKLCDNIKYLFLYATQNEYLFDLSISFVLMKRNFDEFPTLIRLVNTLRGNLPLPVVNVFCQGLEGYDVKGYNEFVAQEHHTNIDREKLVNIFHEALNASKETSIKVAAFYSTPIEDFVADNCKFPPMTDIHASLAGKSIPQRNDITDSSSTMVKNVEVKFNRISISGSFNIFLVFNYKEYIDYINSMTSEYLYRENLEYELSMNGSAFNTTGFCYVCNQQVNFDVNFKKGELNKLGVIPNWRESIVCEKCHLNNRTRGFVHIFEFFAKPDFTTKIYLAEQLSPLYNLLEKKYPFIVGSEYLGKDSPPFAQCANQWVRHQDLTDLTFESNLFDIVMHQDVLEHIPDYISALHECYRVLKPGGYFFFSAPFILSSVSNTVRAQILPDGCIQHLLPPEYHGNPLNSEGCLAFYHFGWELLDQMKSIGFKEPTAIFYWSMEYGHLGRDQFFFMARK